MAYFLKDWFGKIKNIFVNKFAQKIYFYKKTTTAQKLMSLSIKDLSVFCVSRPQIRLILQNSLPEIVIFAIAFTNTETFPPLQQCCLFLALSFLFRLCWNTAIFIHGLGHVLVIAIIDKNLSFICFANILENRSISEIGKSLIPFSSGLVSFTPNDPHPWVAVGHHHAGKIRIKALGGILFNLIAFLLGIHALSQSHDIYGQMDGFVGQFVLQTFVIANFLTALSSLSDLRAAITGTADLFYCGNFGFIGKRQPEDGQVLLPKRVVDIFQTMGSETEIRGEQAGGGLTMGRSRSKQVVFVGHKIVNRKRSNLTRSLEVSFARARQRANASRVKPLESTILGMWHYRYGTSAPPSMQETHWLEWMPARTATVWQIENGKWIAKEKNVNNRITHNGDFDSWQIFGTSIDTNDLGLWLERVLHTPNSTIGDSPKIAGMMDLLVTQGMWEASVRLAYQMVIASFKETFGGQKTSKDAPNHAPSKSGLSKWASTFETTFWLLIRSLSTAEEIFVPDILDKFQKAVVQSLDWQEEMTLWGEKKLSAFVNMAIHSFFYNDTYHAMQLFMERAWGSFGLATVSTLEPEKIVLSSLGQFISIGLNHQEDYAIYASEPSAVDAILSTSSTAKRLDLNQNTGEIALLSDKTLRVYSMTQQRELTPDEIDSRWHIFQDHPFIQTSRRQSPDPVATDLKEIPHVLRTIQDSWINPASLNRQSAEHLLNLLIVKAKYLEDKQQKMLAIGLDPHLAESRTVDILITGMESSLWVGERFAQDLKTVFPLLCVKALSANQVLRRLQYDFQSLRLTRKSIVLAISQSGQTFATVQVLNAFDLLVRKEVIGEVFILTGEPSSFISSPLAQPTFLGEQFSRRILINGSGRRTAEPATVSTAANHQTLTELLFYLARQMQRTFPDSHPFGMTLTFESLLMLERIKDNFLDRSVTRIVGASSSGIPIQSQLHQQLRQSGQKWALHVTESPLAWGIQALYVFITVGWAIPFGYTIPIFNVMFHWFSVAFQISSESLFMRLLHPWITLFDITIYIFGAWFWALGLRYLQGRSLLARIGKRTLVIGDAPWVHQLLKSYVSKLFSLSYGIASLEVHGANPQDHLLHHFGHRVVRGALIFLGVPDGQHSAKQQHDEKAVLMTASQVNGIRNLGVGPEIVLVSSNPAIYCQGASQAITVSNQIYEQLDEPLLDPLEPKSENSTQIDFIETLRESRFCSFERLLSGYVFFWALAKKVASFPFLHYPHWKSQSRTKIMTTASPVSAVNLDRLI